MHKNFSLFLCLLLVIFAGCERHVTTAPFAGSASSPQFNACSLITKEEVQALLGSAINDVKSSVNTQGAFRVSQCFYTAAEFSKSVSLSVTENNPNDPAKRGPRNYWKATFGQPNAEEKKEEGDEASRDRLRGGEEEEKGPPPKEIKGVGDEAFWAGNRVGGALYVLKKDVFIRISVGGSDNEETRINKSKALAEKAVSRL